MLANLSRMDVLARSINTGDTLEQHWLGASFLAACAAGSPELFELLPDEGRLRPLGEYVRAERATKIRLALAKSGNTIPELKPVSRGIDLAGSMITLLCDLQTEGVYISGNTWKGKTAGPESPTVHSVYVDTVKKHLEAVALKLDKKEILKARIVAFRSPAKFPFADSILFFNHTLYLFQVKDVLQKGTGTRNEWTRCAFASEHSEMHNGPLEGLKAAWKATMGIDITHVQYCFVSNCEHDFAEDLESDSTLSPIRKQCKFVVADRKSFLPFEPARAEGQMRIFTFLSDDLPVDNLEIPNL